MPNSQIIALVILRLSRPPSLDHYQHCDRGSTGQAARNLAQEIERALQQQGVPLRWVITASTADGLIVEAVILR
jgi:hypothetical protein